MQSGFCDNIIKLEINTVKCLESSQIFIQYAFKLTVNQIENHKIY